MICETCTETNVEISQEYLDWLNGYSQICPDKMCVNCPKQQESVNG